MKNNFKKWVALFLSVAMIAVSGITTNTSFRAAEGTEVQETAAGDVNGTEGSQTSEVTSGETTPTPVITERPAAPDTKNSTEENSPENTQEVNLSDDQDKTDSVVKPSDTPTPTEKTEDKKAAGENPEDRNSEDAKTEDEKDAEEEEQGPDTEQIEKDLENAEQTTYSCSIGDVTVTADLGTNPHIVPKGASFDVTPVTESTSNYNYNEYLSALNKSAGATADNPVYTSGNTLFYDLAFYYDEPQKDDTKIKTEFEPQSTVSISMKFEKSLSKELGVASDARVKFIHLKNTGNSAYQSGSSNQTPVQVEKIDSNVSADSSNAQFSLDSFSVIAISANPYLTGSADSSTDYQSVLGEALNFGVVTGNFQDGVDAETNVAALKAKCTSQTGNDLTNDVEQTFILAAIDTIFNIKGNGAYVKTTSADSDNVKSVGCKYLIVDTHETKEQLESEVNAMIDYGKTQSSSLAAKTATAKIVYDSVRQKYKLDIRGGDAGTYYVDVDNTTLNEIKESGKLEVYKNDNQTIVFNVAATENLTLQKFLVNNQAPDGLVNSKSDNNTKTIIWNFPNATGIDIEGSVVGVILAPNAEVKVNGTSAGWLISNSVTIGSGEWHNTYQDVKKLRKDAEAVLSAKKNIDGEAANKAGFTFTLSEKTADGKWNELQEYTTTAANPSVINFNRISYKNDEDGFGAGENSRDYIYKISETQGEKDSAGNQYTADSSVYYAKVTVTKTVTKAINTETTLYTATSPEYYQTCSNDGKLSGKIDGVPVFNNQSKGEKTQVSVSKNWVSEAPQGAEVVFTLFRNQSETNQSVTLDGKVDDAGETAAWTATFSNLPKCDSDGKEYSYTVKETDVRNADGYTISDEEVGNNGTITNKKQEITAVSASKAWGADVPEGAEVVFTLFRNQSETNQSVTLDGKVDDAGETEAWTATFSNLPKYDSDGKEYSYTVKETDVRNADGYTISDEEVGNGGTITNTTDTGSAIIISGTKTLTNGTMTAGQFRFDLYENGKKIDTAANDADGKFTFAKIIYNPDDVSAGQTVTHTYTIKEENGGRTINGIRYSSEEKTVTVSVSKDKDGRMTVTSEGGTGSDSSFVNEKLRNLTVHKRWNDNNDEAGVRPSSITVDLQKGNTVVARAVLSESNGWSYTFTDLPYETYTVVEEEIGVDGYQAENGGIVVADTGTDAVTLVNDYNHPSVDIIANKVLTGATLTNGEFMFQLHRNSDPAGVITATAANNTAGEIIFSNIPYDPNGYTVTEVAGDDASITYDTEPVTFSAEGAVTSSAHPEFRNTYRPILLRVQKRSKEAPYDPLVGATYGLYQVVEGGNDILVESEISDENGYMYYGRIQPGVIYYFKEIAAPAGHEVDPYPGQKFQVKYTSNGQIALYDENGNPTTVGDITGQDSKNLLVQYTTEKTAVDTSSSLSYSDDSIVAVAKADNSKAFAAGTKLKVTQLSGSEAKTAAAAVEAACGKINSNIAYYDIQFIDASGNEVEPAGGDVTVTIQYKGNLDLPEGTDRTALKLVHLTKEANGETTVEAVPGTVAADQDGLLQTSFTADSFSTFGVVEPGSDNTLGQNYLVTAAGVADQVSELKVAKLDTAGKYIKGAKLQIIEKATGNVMAEWNTADGPQSFARWFDDAKTLPMNVDTYYILHEVSAPDGYQLADDILFMINKYDSSITVYKYDDNGKLVIDQEAIDKWVSDTTLQMIDVPVKHETVTLVKQKLVPNEKTIQGEDKIVHVTSIQAVRTGDTTPIALFVILLAAAAVVLLILVYRGRKKKDS